MDITRIDDLALYGWLGNAGGVWLVVQTVGRVADGGSIGRAAPAQAKVVQISVVRDEINAHDLHTTAQADGLAQVHPGLPAASVRDSDCAGLIHTIELNAETASRRA